MNKATKIVSIVIAMLVVNGLFGQVWLDLLNDETVSDTLAWVTTAVLVAMNVGLLSAAYQVISRK